jgi:4-aminobutyrate aminotransferase-like enzyme
MIDPIQFPNEDRSNAARTIIGTREPVALRTFTPTQAVLARSAGIFHWTPEDRRLYDYSSGVLVANLGHNPKSWLARFAELLGWNAETLDGGPGYAETLTLTAYNAVTEIEAAAVEKLLENVAASPGGERLDSVCWAASGSEAVQKAIWACLHLRPQRDTILATRYGFHGKKGLAGAVTGCETDHDRDPRVRFISFPMSDCDDYSGYGQDIDLAPYQQELDQLWDELGESIGTLITEPYLGGGGSYHPPPAYLQLLESFCREHDILLILDEVQANFGRTGRMYAFEKYGITPDLVALGKGLGNGIPVSAVVGRSDVLGSLNYGEASDTWSANPISCAAVIATIEAFENSDVLENTRQLEPLFLEQLGRLKRTGVICKVRGEGMVYGIECADVGSTNAADVANAIVEACYLGRDEPDGIHLLGPLAGTVLRISPPMTITEDQARESLELLYRIVDQVGQSLAN